MGGVQGGTNIPILSNLAEPEDRALIISFQASLEGTIASFGPVITVALNNYFGYDPACENQCPATRPAECDADQNADAFGTGRCRRDARAMLHSAGQCCRDVACAIRYHLPIGLALQRCSACHSAWTLLAGAAGMWRAVQRSECTGQI